MNRANNNNMRGVLYAVQNRNNKFHIGCEDKPTMAFGGHVESKLRMCQIFVVQSHFIHFFSLPK